MRISDWSSDVCSSDLTPPTPTTVDFNNQADVLIKCQQAARVAGGTVMDRPEWLTVAPDNSAIFCTLTNNSGRRVTDPANPRIRNLHGHILKFSERSEEHTSELQSLMRTSYAVFCLKKQTVST